jgi:RimJ/RimL family protein N-acetyltransferase
MIKATQQNMNWTGGDGAVFQADFPGHARRDRLASSFFNSQTESASRPPTSIPIIGEKSVRGKGCGKDMAKLMLDYAFGHQNFHRVAIGVVGFNT